jgi:putative ABC transport system permease protein
VFDNVRYAFRSLSKAPAFTTAAVLTIGLGVAASTAIFSMVNGVLLRRIPIAAGDRFVHLRQPSAHSDDEAFSVLEVRALNEQSRTLAGVAEYHSMSFQLYGYGDPLRVQTGVVSDRFFDMLGVKPLLGRTFRRGEEVVGAPPVVVLTHQFWMDQFHGDTSIVGAHFTMNDKVHTVVGVLPPMPSYPNKVDLFMPAGACPFRSAPMMMNAYDMRMVVAFGVLRPGVTLDAAQSEMRTLGDRFHAAHPEAYPAQQRMRFVVNSAREEMTARAKPILSLLLATAVFLMIAAVANVTNLALARHIRRSREMAVRVALGAGVRVLYRQLALESLLLALGGGAIGVGLAASGVGLLRATATRFTPRADEITMSVPVYVFALVLCAVTAAVIAAVPLLHGRRRNLADTLRQGNTGAMASRGEHRLRDGLVILQVATAVVMLVGAGLVGRSLVTLERVDSGVDVSHVLTARLTLNFTRYNTRESARNFAEGMMDRLSDLPGVSAAAMASSLPLGNSMQQEIRFLIEGATGSPSSQMPHSDATLVSPSYFRTVGIPLLRGRDFSRTDRDTNTPPVIVSERLAKNYWGGRDPIGTRISADSGKRWLTVVGVVGDVRAAGLDKDVTDEIYVPVTSAGAGDLQVFLRMTGATPPVVRELRALVHEVDPQQPVAQVQTLEQVRGAELAEPRLTTTLLAVFSIVALVLTATGLAGVIGYAVTQRLPEIAIRLALGSTANRVLLLVMRQGLAIVLVGTVIGFGVALAARRLVAGLLFHVEATDVATYAGVTVLILGLAAVACFVPSRRAARADPAQVFRGG